jgi:thiopurine S-methyltransferase
MDAAFWFTRWQQGRIGFHEGAPNDFLVNNLDRLAGYRRVLVPLCGKAEDLAFLASHGHEVVGVELVEHAVQQFFLEHQATPVVSERSGMRHYAAGAIEIFVGDFFAATAELIGSIDAIYDRAALVALPPDMRARYADHLRRITPAAQRELLVSLEYPPDAEQGPPFSVPEAEVRALFDGAQIDLIGEAPDRRGRAGGKMIERCYDLRFTP